jgi:hypothetical protein
MVFDRLNLACSSSNLSVTPPTFISGAEQSRLGPALSCIGKKLVVKRKGKKGACGASIKFDLHRVIPVKAGIQCLFIWIKALHLGFRRGDDPWQHIITLLTVY